jgi:fermentation-respiration switch protein FrsA (DUF1100 family)
MCISKRHLKTATALGCASLALALPSCTHLFYHPTDVMYVRETEHGKLREVREEVSFNASDGAKLAAWWLPARAGKREGRSRGTVVQFHGNAENMTSHFFSLFWLTEQGYDLMTFDYRGYGISPGKPTQAGLDLDAQAAIRYALARTAPSGPVALYGQSLGGAVLLHAYGSIAPEERKRVRAIVIESSFHSYKSIARDVLSRSWLTYLLQPLAYVLVSNSTSPKNSIERVSPTPLLVVHGEKDPMIPFEFGEEIYERARPPKRFHRVPGGTHLDAPPPAKAEARRVILDFLAQPPSD